MSLVRNLAWTGGLAALLSAATAAAFSRLENRRAAPAMNAVSHIVWGGPPPYDDGGHRENLAVGAALHTGSSFFWALVFESVFGRKARANANAALMGGPVTAAGAYVTDYGLVPRRLRPSFEAYLSRPALLGIYGRCGYAACCDGRPPKIASTS